MPEIIDYSRQINIPGLSQTKLESSNALIFGNNILAEFIAIGMQSCGTNVTLIGSGSPNNSCIFSKNDDVFAISQMLESLFINRVHVFGFYKENMRLLLQGVNYIFNVSEEDFHQTIELGKKLGVPVAFIITNKNGLDVWINPEQAPEPDEISKDVGTALIAAGIAVHLFIKHICPDIEYAVPEDHIHYEAFMNEHSSINKVMSISMVGAGGIGGALSFALAQYTNNLDIYDGDRGEAHNRNRNPWLINNELKVDSLKYWLEMVYPDLICNAHNIYINDRNFLKQKKCNVIVGGPDNWKARKIMYQGAMDKGIPYVNGGCSISGGCAYVSYGRGGPACLNCRKPELDEIINGDENNSCSRLSLPSILPSNWITAGMMSHCVYDVINRGKDCFAGTMLFDTQDPKLFSRHDDIRCDCVTA